MARSRSTKLYCYEYARPALTVDIVLFRKARRRVAVLLIQRAREPLKGRWAFPGGFVDKDESLENAAARELREETGLSDVSIEQLATFGDPGRDPRGHTVSVVFYGIVTDRVKLTASDDAAEARWHSALRPPPLAFDHEKILAEALRRISQPAASKKVTRR